MNSNYKRNHNIHLGQFVRTNDSIWNAAQLVIANRANATLRGVPEDALRPREQHGAKS
jgi:hypothetical protein